MWCNKLEMTIYYQHRQSEAIMLVGYVADLLWHINTTLY